MPFASAPRSRRRWPVRPVRVVGLAINWTITWWVSRGLPRQFWVMKANSRCSIRFHLTRLFGLRPLAALGSRADRPVLAAALLHDMGKTACGLGTFGRVVATLAGLVGSRHRTELDSP